MRKHLTKIFAFGPTLTRTEILLYPHDAKIQVKFSEYFLMARDIKNDVWGEGIVFLHFYEKRKVYICIKRITSRCPILPHGLVRKTTHQVK